MKSVFIFFAFLPTFSMANEIDIQTRRPEDFVNVTKIIPLIQTDMRYFSAHNFVGRRIKGYQAPVCLLTRKSTMALKKVVEQLVPMGLTVKVYDCYRPQTAVNDFVEWASIYEDTVMRTEFYPAVNKDRLFSEGYIAAHSGHSRGSTVDLTIVPLGSPTPFVDTKPAELNSSAPQTQRHSDNTLDFGTGFDFFGPESHPSYQNISPQAKANRLLLRTLMVTADFKPLDTEWWHFTLANEPYPDTYFDFPVEE